MYQPEIWHARRPGMVLYKIDRFLEIFEYMEFWKYIYISVFSVLGKNFFGGKIRDSHFEELYSMSFGAFYLHFS